jgi:hypothetical protein
MQITNERLTWSPSYLYVPVERLRHGIVEPEKQPLLGNGSASMLPRQQMCNNRRTVLDVFSMQSVWYQIPSVQWEESRRESSWVLVVSWLPESWENKMGSWVPRDWESRMAVLARTRRHLPSLQSLGVKRSGHEADHSPPSNAETKNTWTYTSTSPYIFLAQCLISSAQR